MKAEKSFRLVEYRDVTTKEKRVALLVLNPQTFQFEKIDDGTDGDIEGNYVVIQYDTGQYRLYCYSKGLLTQGPLCAKYMRKDGRFVFADAENVWWTAKHECQGFDPLGQYYGQGIWVLQKPRTVLFSIFVENKWTRQNYKSLEKFEDGPLVLYILEKKGGYDIIMVNHNEYIFLYENLTEEIIQRVKEEKSIHDLGLEPQTLGSGRQHRVIG